MFTRTSSFVVAAALSAATITFPAYAADKVPEIQVSHADLDLSSDSGRSELRSRISRAAGEICRKMGQGNVAEGCRSKLTQRTLATVKFPTTTAVAAR